MFSDRSEAGRKLAAELVAYTNGHVVVIGLPRGGVPVAHEIAKAMNAPLDVVVVRKLGCPGNLELGFGAISEEDVVVFNHDVIRTLGISQLAIDHAIARERITLNDRIASIRARYPQVDVKDRTVIIIDDGIATGIDAKAACRVARARGAKRVVLAVPVAPSGWTTAMAREADDLVALEEDPSFMSVGAYYDDFSQVSDEQVLACLESTCLTP